MIGNRLIAHRTLLTLSLIVVLSLGNKLAAPDGRKLFSDNCASCHNPIKDLLGPALKGVTSRVPDKALLHSWIRNNGAVRASGNPYFNSLFNKWNKTAMTPFPTLTDGEIDAILNYVETFTPPKAPNEGGPKGGGSYNEDDNSILYGVL